MAVLTRAEKKKIASPWSKTVQRDLGQSKNLTVTDLEAVAQYTEDWIVSVRGGYIAGLPQSFKENADTPAHDLCLAYGAMRRAGLL